MRISDWSSDVCSSDLKAPRLLARALDVGKGRAIGPTLSRPRGESCLLGRFDVDGRHLHFFLGRIDIHLGQLHGFSGRSDIDIGRIDIKSRHLPTFGLYFRQGRLPGLVDIHQPERKHGYDDKRSEEHTSELQSLMRISYA